MNPLDKINQAINQQIYERDRYANLGPFWEREEGGYLYCARDGVAYPQEECEQRDAFIKIFEDKIRQLNQQRADS